MTAAGLSVRQGLIDLGFRFTGAGRPIVVPAGPADDLPVDIIDDEDPAAPLKSRPFEPGALRPRTRLLVVDRDGRYRGAFATGPRGRVAHVVVASGSFDAFEGEWRWPEVDLDGNPLPRAGQVHGHMTPAGRGSSLHPDLNRSPLLPDVDYHVDERFHFSTDAQGRVSRLVVTQVEMPAAGSAPSRNTAMTGAVGRQGGPSYDGGHTVAREQSGPNERINLVAMLRTVNRAQAGADVRTNFRRFEQAVGDLARTYDVRFAVRQRFTRADVLVPATIEVRLDVAGQMPDPISYRNV